MSLTIYGCLPAAQTPIMTTPGEAGRRIAQELLDDLRSCPLSSVLPRFSTASDWWLNTPDAILIPPQPTNQP